MANAKKNRSSKKVRRELLAQKKDAERAMQRAQQHVRHPQRFQNEENIDVEAAFEREKERRRDKDRPLTDVERKALAKPRPTSAQQKSQGKMQSSFAAWSARFLRRLSGRRQRSYHRLAKVCGPEVLQLALRICPMMLTVVKEPVPRALRDDASRAKKAARSAERLAEEINYITHQSTVAIEGTQSRLPELLGSFANQSRIMAKFITEPGYSANRQGDLLLTVLDALRSSDVTQQDLADLLMAAAEAEGKGRIFTPALVRMRVKRFREDPNHALKADKMAGMIRARVTNDSTNHARRKR